MLKKIDLVVTGGTLDRAISELLELSDDKNMDGPDARTLERHAVMMKAAATLINDRAHSRLLQLQQQRTEV